MKFLSFLTNESGMPFVFPDAPNRMSHKVKLGLARSFNGHQRI